MSTAMTYPFFTGRLGPGSCDRAKEHQKMSIILLQGGGLSKAQIDDVPLQTLQLRSLFRPVATAILRGWRRLIRVGNGK